MQLLQDRFQKIPPFADEDACSSESKSSLDRLESIFARSEADVCDATQRHHPGLIQKAYPDNGGYIVGGSLTALIHELLRTDNEEYIRVFLLSYSVFTTGSVVLSEIKLNLDTTLENRALHIFAIWCQDYALDIVGDVASGIISILEKIGTNDAKVLKKSVLDTMDTNAKLAECDEIKFGDSIEETHSQEEIDTSDIENILEVNGGTINLSNLLITGLTSDIFLRIHPDSFADHVYYFHLSRQIRHGPALRNPVSYLPRPQTSVEMLNSLLFTTASAHFLTRLVRNQLLIESQQYQGIEGTLLRTKLLNHWILVGTKLYQLGDATGWCAVAIGLCSAGIVRLREAWRGVKREMVQTVQISWARILTEYGMFEQSIWTSAWKNEKHLRFSRILDLKKPGGVPFFGTIKQAIDRYRKHSTKPLGAGIINFEAYRYAYKSIKHSLEEWKESSSELKIEEINCVGPLQSFFEYSVTDLVSVPHDLNYLQEASWACEPRVYGYTNYFLSQVSTEAKGNSILQLPVILDSCKLWDSEWTFVYSPKKMIAENVCSTSNPFSSKLMLESTSKENSPNIQRHRRRTLSFPPGANHIMASGESYSNRKEILESINSRTWLGSLASGRQHSTYPSKALMEAHRKNRAARSSSGEFDLVVAEGNLIFKVATVLRNEKQNNPSLKRIESIHSVQFLDQEKETDGGESELLVTLKGASFECLVECLIRGIDPYEDALKDQWQMLYLTEGLQYQTKRVVIDEENFINVFFTSYRSYQSPTYLLSAFQKYFIESKSKCKFDLKKKNNSLAILEAYFSKDNLKNPVSQEKSLEDEVTSYDWKKVASIQLRILNLLFYWIEEHPCDFIDEPEFIRYINVFLEKSTESLDDWCNLLKSHLSKASSDESCLRDITDALHTGEKVQQKMVKLEEKFIQNTLSPSYDTKSVDFDTDAITESQALYGQLIRGSKVYGFALYLTTDMKPPISIAKDPVDEEDRCLIDIYSPEVLLEQLDKNASQLFECISIQDWSQTFDSLELQCNCPHMWLPSRKSAYNSKIFNAFATVAESPTPYPSEYRVLAEEVVISDIFSAIQGARRPAVSPSAGSDEDLLSSFPLSIQCLYTIHFVIRNWAIQEMSSLKIDTKKRKMRIHKFLQIVLLSKTCSEKMALFPELKRSESNKKRVPGFVENAIASALVSPEVRLFTKTWNSIALQYGMNSIESLESLLIAMQKAPSSIPSLEKEAFCSVVSPSLGWILERVVEICFTAQNTIENKKNLINFDKRRYLYHFLQLVINVQAEIHQQLHNNVGSRNVNMSFLVFPSFFNVSWKDLKDQASLENKKGALQNMSSGKVLRGPSSRYLGSKSSPFNKTVAKQLERLKKDYKERDHSDKDPSFLQQRLQKKHIDQTKLEKQERPHSMMPRINSFIKGLRPPSLVVSPIHHIFPSSNNQDQHTSFKASNVVNLINSATSVARTYTKRDYVFRVVTEEGGQYLFQGTSSKDMLEWIGSINDSAREGTMKRQSVLAAESKDNHNERRNGALLIEAQSRHPSPSHRKSVFGVHVDCLMSNGVIPLIVEKCIKEIEKRGLEEVGIYRVAGAGSVVSMLKAELNKDVQKVDLGNSKWADINVVADSLKHFLRELPEPLMTYTHYDEFVHASASEDHDQRVYLIKEVIKKLPYNNYTLLKRIIEHFVTVTDFEGINHMYATNLAIVFGPTLLQPTPGPALFATTMSNLGHHQNIVKYLILNYHYFFDVEGEELESKEEQILDVE
ncbi:hypothetical protein BY458DRAFT_443505 [Sporodiniella umbellata]|nr:hypothetical protein BY458DRAFT_443505 [Sporodiniella umbellata]